MASNIDYESLGLPRPSSSSVDRSALGIPSASKKAPAPAGWVSQLQSALLAKAKEGGIQIDLGKTGPNGDGVDGRYGSKTKAAVQAVGAALNITPALDKSGRPSEAMTAGLGLTAAPPPAPPAKTTPAQPERPAASRPVRKRGVLGEIQVGGAQFYMTAFLGALPEEIITLQHEPWQAAQALAQMEYALKAGGITLKNSMPKDFSAISNREKYESYMFQVRLAADEIVVACRLVANSFLAAVNARRKELNMAPVKELSPHESPEVVYDFEHTYWDGARTAVANAARARKNLEYKLRQFYQGERKPLLDLLIKSKGAGWAIFNNLGPEDTEVAKNIGAIIAGSGIQFAHQMDPSDNGYYFDYNLDLTRLIPRMAEVLKVPDAPAQIRQVIGAK